MVVSRCKVDLFCICGFSELAVFLRLETKAVGCSNFNEVTETLFITPFHILCAPLELTQLIGSQSI